MVPPVEGEEVQVHGAGGHDAEPGAVADGAGVVQPGGLLGPGRDLHRRGDHRVRQPEVLQPGHGDTIKHHILQEERHCSVGTCAAGRPPAA